MLAPPALLVFYLAATLAAFGGIYRPALPLFLAGAAALALIAFRLGPDPSPDTKAIDRALLIVAAMIGLQLIPLPALLRGLLSPRRDAVERALRIDGSVAELAWAPLSLDPESTAWALTVVVAAVLTYVAARRILGRGGVRQVCGGLTAIAALASAGALLQRAVTPGLIYGYWRPEHGEPFGSVVNRNHFAAWLVMASALSAGYLIARISRRHQVVHSWRAWRHMVVSIGQSSVSWTAVLWAATTVTVFAAQSRSAVVGLGVAFSMLARTVTRSWKPVVVLLLTVTVGGGLLLVLGESVTTQLANRFASTMHASGIGRTVIWRETWPMVTAFPLTGVGAGAYGRAMLAFQQTRVYVPHLGTEWHFNQAHNHYLQLTAEGGVLLLLPVAVTAVLFVRIVMRRIREERGELRAVRLGAVAGLAGVATQSLWEVPLTMPAAALLAATLAALATYKRATAPER